MIRDLLKSFIPGPSRGIGLWNNFGPIFLEQYNFFFDRIKKIMRNTHVPEETEYPGLLADNLGAYVAISDSPGAVRRKAARANFVHKRHLIFDDVWKPIIDGITGGSSSIYKGAILYGQFVVGESIVGSPAIIGPVPFVDRVSQDQLANEVYINLGLTPTSEQILEMRRQLEPMAAIYQTHFFGELETVDSGFFVVGSSIVGGIDVIGVDTDPQVNFKVAFIIKTG